MKYCTATNTGAGFITWNESIGLNIYGYPGNVWVTVKDDTSWITRVGGVEKTLTEAQAITNTAVADAQTAWDAAPENGEPYVSDTGYLKGGGPRPEAVVLPNAP